MIFLLSVKPPPVVRWLEYQLDFVQASQERRVEMRDGYNKYDGRGKSVQNTGDSINLPTTLDPPGPLFIYIDKLSPFNMYRVFDR